MHEIEDTVFRPCRALRVWIVGDARFICFEEHHVLLWRVEHVVKGNVDAVGRSHALSIFPNRVEVFCSRNNVYIIAEEIEADDRRGSKFSPAQNMIVSSNLHKKRGKI